MKGPTGLLFGRSLLECDELPLMIPRSITFGSLEAFIVPEKIDLNDVLSAEQFKAFAAGEAVTFNHNGVPMTVQWSRIEDDGEQR